MTLPGFPSRIVLWHWSVTPGIADSRTFTFLDAEGGDYDPGVVTAKAKDGTVSATVTGTGNTRIVTWSAEQTAALPPTHWRLNFDGEDQVGGRIEISQPEPTPDLSNDWTIQLPGDGEGDGLTITVAGGNTATPTTHTIPLVGQWNPPLITETGTGLTQNVFLIGCPVLASFHPELGLDAIAPPPATPYLAEVAQPTTPPTDPPALPTVDDIPADWTPFPGQEIEAADIFGALIWPLDYIPPESKGVPMWVRGRSVDNDGDGTMVYLWFPNGIGPTITDVDVVMFSEGVRSQFTIPAAPDATTPGVAVDMTVYFGGPPGAAVALSRDAARIAAMEARLTALEG